MKVKCAVFDFDGTLFDSMPIWDSAGEIYLHSLGKEPRPPLRDDIRAFSMHQTACYLRKEYNLSLSPEQIMAGINQTVEHFYTHEVLPKPGVIGFLERMRQAHIPMCIATASDRCQIEAALSRCGMEHYFEAVFTCSEVGHGKDEPEIFRKAMEYFDADRSTTVVFEDAVHAVRTAKGDGFVTIAVFDSSETQQEEIRRLSDCCLEDFEHTEEFWKLVSAE
ncbi:MAG: HAD family phosphatase [Fretibacterium sp.]|nr:HAD family phosphatase [Fretibacterium sp.]